MPLSTYVSVHRVPVENAVQRSMLAMYKEEPDDPLRFLGQHLISQAAHTSSEAVEDYEHLKDRRIAELEKRVAELEAGAAAGPMPTPGRTLEDAVASWRQARPQPTAPDSTAQELNAKFAASSNTITYSYGDVAMFFAGLEGLVGSPSPEVMPTMMLEHASTEPFKAWNSDVERTTTPLAEWTYVTERAAGTADAAEEDGEITERQPSHFKDGSGDRRHWKLKDFALQPQIVKAGLLLAEVAGVRLYTGPMYVHYNRTLRNHAKGAFVTSLHAINSGIIKLSKLTPACTVYRGVAGGVLPEQFWTPNDHGVMGGIELGFMSTTTSREVALMYMQQSGKAAKMVFEIRMGMIDRGADVSLLSQFPGEKEILFAPLTGLEVVSVPRVEEGDIIVVELRLSCNLHDLTIEEVIGKMQTGHKSMVQNMLDDLKPCSPTQQVLQPLHSVLDDATRRGHAFFNVPTLFRQATEEALAAQASIFNAIIQDEVWQAVTGSADEVAAQMCSAAKLCARHDLHESAARLLTMAVRRCPVSMEDAAAVAKACTNSFHRPTVMQRAALQAARLLMVSGDCRRSPWPLTLLALAREGGHDSSAAGLATASGQPASLVRMCPFDEDATPNAVKGSALLSAAAAGDGDGVASALAAGADANGTAENDVTALMLAARAGSVSAVTALLANGADAERVSRKSCTALALAAEVGAADCAALLVTEVGGTKVDASDETGMTPLIDAAQRGQLDVVEILLAKGAAIDVRRKTDSCTALYLAAQNGHEDVVAVLLAKEAQVDLADYLGKTPLLQAVWKGHEAVVALLLANGAHVDLAADDGTTPLSKAAWKGTEAVVAALLSKGAQVDLADDKGRTPLFMAAMEGHEVVVATLLANGAQVDKSSNSGNTPLMIARKKRRGKTVAVLTAHAS